MKHIERDRQAVRAQRADIDAALVHLRALVALTAQMRDRNHRTAFALGGIEEPSEYFHPVVSVATIGAHMSRVYSPEGLRRVEIMLAELDARANGEQRCAS
jgi:hypothetical protein